MKFKNSLLTLCMLLSNLHVLNLNASASASSSSTAAASSSAADSSVSAPSISAGASSSEVGLSAAQSAPIAAPAASVSTPRAAAAAHRSDEEIKQRDENKPKGKKSRRAGRGVSIREARDDADSSSSSDSIDSDKSSSRNLLALPGAGAAAQSLIVIGDASAAQPFSHKKEAAKIRTKAVASAAAAVEAREVIKNLDQKIWKEKDEKTLEEERAVNQKKLDHQLKQEKAQLRKVREATKELEKEFESEDDREYEERRAKRRIRLEEEAKEEAEIQGRSYVERKKAMQDPIGFRIAMATTDALEKGYQDAIAEEVRDGVKGVIKWAANGIYYSIPANERRRAEGEEHVARENGMMKGRMLLANRAETTLTKSKALAALNNGSLKQELEILDAEKNDIVACIELVKTVKSNTSSNQNDALFEKFQANKDAVLANSAANIEQQVTLLMNIPTKTAQDEQRKEAMVMGIMQGMQMFAQLQEKAQFLAAMKDDNKFALIHKFLTIAREGKTVEIQQAKETFKKTSRQLMQELVEQNQQQSVYNQDDAMKLRALLMRSQKNTNSENPAHENNEEIESEEVVSMRDVQKQEAKKTDKNVLKAAGA